MTIDSLNSTSAYKNLFKECGGFLITYEEYVHICVHSMDIVGYYPFVYKQLPIIIYHQKYYPYNKHTWYELISNYTFQIK